MLLPDHEPEVADGVDKGALCENVLSVGFLHFDEIGVDIVSSAPLEDDPAVVIGADIPIPVQVFVLWL